MQSLSRRSFLTFAGAGAAALLTHRRGLAAPAIVAPEITPQAFGARGTAATDSAAWTEAVKEASATGRPVLARGTFVLSAPAGSSWNWANQARAPVHVSVPLLSNVTIQGDAVIVAGAPERPLAQFERHLLFGTGLNAQPGTLSNIAFDGLTFDFREEFGPLHSFTYAIGVTGVDNFQRRNVSVVSTGTQNGRGLLSENVRGRTDTDIVHRNIGQGIYTRYERNVTMRNISFDTFNEAMDFDGPCWDVLLEKLSFRKARREAQCIDTGGGARWIIRDVVAEDTGAICYIYAKANAWPDYQQWLASRERFTPDYVAMEDLTISNVTGTRCGGRRKKGEALLIGAYRNRQLMRRQHLTRGPRKITAQDWLLTDCGQIAVHDCEDVTLRRITMTGSQTPLDPATGAALLLQVGPVADGGAISGEVSSITVRNSSGSGVSAAAGPELKLEDITVEGFGRDMAPGQSAGVRVRPRIGGREHAAVGKTQVSGGPSDAPPVDARAEPDPDPEVAAREERRRRKQQKRN